jgi:hypothetical protein
MTQLSNKPEYEARPAVSLPNGQRVHYTAHDWDDITATTITSTGTKWPVGGIFRAARDLQATAVHDFGEAGKAITKIMSDKDLTREAKQRKAKEALDQYADGIEKERAKLAESVKGLGEAMRSHFSPTKPLEKGDAVGVAMDAELRSILRGMEPMERSRLINEAREGKHPELTAAILRAPALASGLPPSVVESLRNAGIAASFGQDIQTIRQLIMVGDDVLRTTTKAAETLQKMSGVTHPAFGRLSADPASDAREWINSLPAHRMSTEQAA